MLAKWLQWSPLGEEMMAQGDKMYCQPVGGGGRFACTAWHDSPAAETCGELC